ncbi:MAG TPA: hypothetical protein DD738_10410 [Ruminiclostridium sp.]|nr:hypothetical protein [Ruminiclostridium sp.]
MNKKLKRMISMVLALVILVAGPYSEIQTYAAADTVNLSVSYNSSTNQYDISFPLDYNPGKVIVNYHGPDYKTDDPTAFQIDHTYSSGTVKVGLDLSPDHVYDFTVDVYKNYDDASWSHQGSLYYLADMTFTGESFNMMALNYDIEDKAPVYEKDGEGRVVTVKSGENPMIRLKWKIPTMYCPGEGLVYLTDSKALSVLQKPDIPIAKACFQIIMTVGQGSTRRLEFNTDYSETGDMIVEGKDLTVSGFSGGTVTDPDGFVSIVLEKEHGIEPGTEYEYTNIGIVFENSSSHQVSLRQTKLSAHSDNHFMVHNMDNAFDEYGGRLSSVFTPIQIELTKVDIDKVQVRFQKITNGVYPELHYQVQYAPKLDDLFMKSNNWVKIPDSSISASEGYGSEIVTIHMTGIDHPEYYFRVVFYDSSSDSPISSSLCVDLRHLDADSGRPPLVKGIKAEAVYAGRQEVTVPSTDLSQGNVKIPASDLRISLEKPASWAQIKDWEAFKATPYNDEDFTFHVLLSTYLPESAIGLQTKKIGLSETKEIYLPVKQKRVLVLGKQDFIEDPNDSGRIICTLPGDRLFYDFVGQSSLMNENNEDTSKDGVTADYPTFLVPNTTYYMQIFTSWKRDNQAIYDDIWGDSEGLTTVGLGEKLSFTSSFASFTTWPLKEMPVPMPDIQLGIEPETNVDPNTGEITLDGIAVNYNRVLTYAGWDDYTSENEDRSIVYEFYLSRNAAVFDDSTPTAVAEYPDNDEMSKHRIIIDTDNEGKAILPNTVYYVKARATLVVGGIAIGSSDFTAIKAVTTPKIDSGGVDEEARDPRAPSEFSIALDQDGNPMLSDAWVFLAWLHAEEDVSYEMICTSTKIDSGATAEDYASDITNINFLKAYDAQDTELFIDPADPDSSLAIIDGLRLNEDGSVLMPIKRDFLRPNRVYYFSLRAVRRTVDSSGNTVETISQWITIPVTTKMVAAPAFLEAVEDMEIGFHTSCTANGAAAESMEVYLKKAKEKDSQYRALNRSQYTCVKDGSTFYFRLYNLEADQWYDIQVKNNTGNTWYDGETENWKSARSEPVQAKTRNPFQEIEVRWEGEEPYDYYLEARTSREADYVELSYSSSGFTDYGYDLADGTRIEFYREKTNLYVEEDSEKYIYYALIRGKPVQNSSGNLKDQPLKSNTDYYVKLWAYNLEESIHIGPVHIRTDFSQDDYDDDQEEDDIIDLFDQSAEKFSRKLYWCVDMKKGTSLRIILKEDKVAGLLQEAYNSTVTVDLTGENKSASYYEVLIPHDVLEALEAYNSRLSISVAGTEITLNRGSIDMDSLKDQALNNKAREAMLLLRVNLAGKSDKAFPAGYKTLSDIVDFQAVAVGSRLAYSEINGMLHDILYEPDASGPFKYGILDREMTEVLQDMEDYSYLSYTDLRDRIDNVMLDVEIELSKYLKDIIDGGRGLKADFAVTKEMAEFPGGIGMKLAYSCQDGYTGYITPFVNYGLSWAEPSGSKASMLQMVLFRVEKPGRYMVAGKAQVVIQPGGTGSEAYLKLAAKYDLSKVFGSGTIHPANPIKGEQAVMLYAVLIQKESEMTGLTPVQKASKLGLSNILAAKQLTGYMDNQSSLSLAVKLYCTKAHINEASMLPSRTIVIANDSAISSRIYKYVVLGIDLGIAELQNNTFDAAGQTTVGGLLDMMAKALDKLEQ